MQLGSVTVPNKSEPSWNMKYEKNSLFSPPCPPKKGKFKFYGHRTVSLM